MNFVKLLSTPFLHLLRTSASDNVTIHRGVFRTLLNIFDETFLQTNSIADIWQGSEYASRIQYRYVVKLLRKYRQSKIFTIKNLWFVILQIHQLQIML